MPKEKKGKINKKKNDALPVQDHLGWDIRAGGGVAATDAGTGMGALLTGGDVAAPTEVVAAAAAATTAEEEASAAAVSARPRLATMAEGDDEYQSDDDATPQTDVAAAGADNVEVGVTPREHTGRHARRATKTNFADLDEEGSGDEDFESERASSGGIGVAAPAPAVPADTDEARREVAAKVAANLVGGMFNVAGEALAQRHGLDSGGETPANSPSGLVSGFVPMPTISETAAVAATGGGTDEESGGGTGGAEDDVSALTAAEPGLVTNGAAVGSAGGAGEAGLGDDATLPAALQTPHEVADLANAGVAYSPDAVTADALVGAIPPAALHTPHEAADLANAGVAADADADALVGGTPPAALHTPHEAAGGAGLGENGDPAYAQTFWGNPMGYLSEHVCEVTSLTAATMVAVIGIIITMESGH